MSTGTVFEAEQYFAELRRVTAHLPFSVIDAATAELWRANSNGRAIYVFGNGGSAALASHFACDLGKGTAQSGSGPRFRIVALTDNVPILTAWANDSSYDDVFAEPLRNLVQPGDVAVAISCSGSSANVIRALQVARGSGARTIGFTGFQGGQMKSLCDICIVVPSDNMQIIEDVHLSIAHTAFTIIRNRRIQVAAEAAVGKL